MQAEKIRTNTAGKFRRRELILGIRYQLGVLESSLQETEGVGGFSDEERQSFKELRDRLNHTHNLLA